MFHWICPECGQEIAPGVKECPVCEPQAIAPSTPFGGPSVAAAPAPEASAAAPVAAPPAPVVGRSVVEQPIVNPSAAQPLPEPPIVIEPEVFLHPEVILKPQAVPQPQAFDQPRPRAVLDAIPLEARPLVMPDVPLGTSPVELPDPLMDRSMPDRSTMDRPPEPETFADRLADLAERLHGEHIPYGAPRIFQESAAPGPFVGHAGQVEQAAPRTPVILDVPFQRDVAFRGEQTQEGPPANPLLASPPSVLLLAEPQPPAVAAGIPMEEVFCPRPAEHAAPSPQPRGAEPAPLGTVRLPDAASYTPAPALAPFQDYHQAADRQMRPAEYPQKLPSVKALDTVTLPGPTLPRELMSLQAAGLVPIRSGRRREGPSSRFGWLTYVVVAMLLTAGVATYNLLPRTAASAPLRPAPQPAPEPPVAARSTNSLARLVEVTGIRFMEVNQKPQIRYLVVNHSSAPLNSILVYVTLRASHAKPGQPPIARLNFRSPALAAFEAKEMFSSIERASSPLDLPDWQDLHADVEVQ